MSDVRYGVEINASGGDQASGEFKKLADAQAQIPPATKEAAKAAEDYVQSLKKQVDTLGMASLAVKAYEGDQLRLTEAQKQLAAQSLLTIKAYDDQQAAIKSLSAAAVAGVTAATALAGAFIYKTKTAIDAAAALSTFSEKTGIAVERLAALKYAADLSDTSIDTLGRALARLPKSLIEGSNPNSEAGRAFGFLGIDPTSLKTEEQAIDAIATAITNVQDPMAKSAALQMIFKRNGEELIPLFNQGADGIKRMTDEGAHWNAISGISSQQAKQLKDDVVTLNYATSAAARAFAAEIVPGLTRFIEQALEGIRVAGGLRAALLTFGTMNPFQTPGEQIKSLNQQLQQLQQNRASAAASGLTTSGSDVAIDTTQKQLDYAKFMQRQGALAGGTNYPDTASRMMAASTRSGMITGMPNARATSGGAGPDDGQSQIIALQNQLASVQGEASEVDKAIRMLTEGKKQFTVEAQATILALAGEVDQWKTLKIVVADALEYSKQLTADQDKRDAQTVAFDNTLVEHIADIEFETSTYAMSNAEKEKAIELRKLDAQYQIAKQGLDETELANLKLLYDADKARLEAALDNRRVAIDNAQAATDAAKQQADLIKAQEQEWNRLWTSVEGVGKQAFVHIFSDGKNAFQSIGQALKTSVIDLLYELTARQWIISIGTSVASSLGIPTSATAKSMTGLAGGGGSSGGSFDIGSLLSGNNIGSFLGSGFQNLGVSMGSQGIADIGNALNGVSNGNMLGYLGAGLQLAQGNFGGAAGTAIGTYFGGPIGGAIGSFVGSKLGSLIGGGGGGPASFSGYSFQGSASAAGGLQGATTAHSANSEDSFSWASSIAPSVLAMFNDDLSAAAKEMESYGKMMKLSVSGVEDVSGSVSFSGIGYNANDMLQALKGQIVNVTDQMALKMMPTLAQYQQQNESLTQTFVRLAQAQQAADFKGAIDSMSAVLHLSDQVHGFLTSDLSPLTNQQKLDALSSQYTSTLAAANGGDLTATGNLGNVAQQYLTQARSFYASSADYTGIFNQVQSDVGNLTTNTLTDQSITVSNMGLSLDQIASNTQNLDQRIAQAIAAAFAAQSDASDAIIEAQTKAIVQAILQSSSPVLA